MAGRAFYSKRSGASGGVARVLALALALAAATTARRASAVTPSVVPRAAAALGTGTGTGSGTDPSRFALIIGVNRASDSSLPELHYADDDAARYDALFRALGFRTFLLTRFDANTERLHRDVAAEAYRPRGGELSAAVALLASAASRAHEQGQRVLLYVVYAGHGQVERSEGFVLLEDRRLSGAMLRREIIERVGADETHLIVDACNSYYLAYSRGPGGRRRPYRGFAQLEQAFPDQRVGLLLSTSTARASHEWEGFQAGVFSHEVRSGLFGAADADRDGRVSYRELVAFVARANQAIDNERFRPQVFARPPRGVSALLDLRSAHRTIEVAARLHGRYVLEDGRGVRLADFHSAPGQAVRLVRPAGPQVLFLQRLGAASDEYEIRDAGRVVQLAALQPRPSAVRARGAAHEAFQRVFSLPFDEGFVQRFVWVDPAAAAAERGSRVALRRWLGWSAVGTGVAALTAALALSGRAASRSSSDNDALSQLEAAARNRELTRSERAAALLYGVSGAALAGGALALLWPRWFRASPSRTAGVAGAALLPAAAGWTLTLEGSY
ncbi:MAG: hypothetical protein IPL40_05715 [Proteobacteria bacterium]|nr:hypothetical protein [Pseudomonadota bacterium]